MISGRSSTDSNPGSASHTAGSRLGALGGGAPGPLLGLGQEKAYDVLGAAALAELRWSRVNVALAGVSERAA